MRLLLCVAALIRETEPTDAGDLQALRVEASGLGSVPAPAETADPETAPRGTTLREVIAVTADALGVALVETAEAAGPTALRDTEVGADAGVPREPDAPAATLRDAEVDVSAARAGEASMLREEGLPGLALAELDGLDQLPSTTVEQQKALAKAAAAVANKAVQSRTQREAAFASGPPSRPPPSRPSRPSQSRKPEHRPPPPPPPPPSVTPAKAQQQPTQQQQQQQQQEELWHSFYDNGSPRNSMAQQQPTQQQQQEELWHSSYDNGSPRNSMASRQGPQGQKWHFSFNNNSSSRTSSMSSQSEDPEVAIQEWFPSGSSITYATLPKNAQTPTHRPAPPPPPPEEEDSDSESGPGKRLEPQKVQETSGTLPQSLYVTTNPLYSFVAGFYERHAPVPLWTRKGGDLFLYKSKNKQDWLLTSTSQESNDNDAAMAVAIGQGADGPQQAKEWEVWDGQNWSPRKESASNIQVSQSQDIPLVPTFLYVNPSTLQKGKAGTYKFADTWKHGQPVWTHVDFEWKEGKTFFDLSRKTSLYSTKEGAWVMGVQSTNAVGVESVEKHGGKLPHQITKWKEYDGEKWKHDFGMTVSDSQNEVVCKKRVNAQYVEKSGRARHCHQKPCAEKRKNVGYALIDLGTCKKDPNGNFCCAKPAQAPPQTLRKKATNGLRRAVRQSRLGNFLLKASKE